MSACVQLARLNSARTSGFAQEDHTTLARFPHQLIHALPRLHRRWLGISHLSEERSERACEKRTVIKRTEVNLAEILSPEYANIRTQILDFGIQFCNVRRP